MIPVSEESESGQEEGRPRRDMLGKVKALGDFPGMKGRLWWSLRKTQKNKFHFRKNNPDED